MSRFVVYTAVSLDGYIADEEGSVHWLEAFERDDYGYEEFLGSIGSILVGRVTYEQIRSFGEWPYKTVPALIWSKNALTGLPEGVESSSESVDAAASWLREKAGRKDIWILGGARVIQEFLDAGLVDRMDIFIIPVLLGGGVRLFNGDEGGPRILRLEHSQPYANGVVQLTYTRRQGNLD